MKKLYVGNLPFSATEAAVNEMFSKHGNVHSVALINDRETGRPRGFAFVEMPNGSEAKEAIEKLNETEIAGRAVIVNEAADPDVARDLAAAYQAMVPQISFAHAEGNSDAHLFASLLGSSVSLPVEAGHLKLGTWQGIFFVELDGPRTRRVWVSAV